MKAAPALLVAFRALAGPALVVGAVAGYPGWVLALVVSLAFLSDVFDGVIARRIGVATDALRRADSIVDAAFYLAALVAVYLRVPAALQAVAIPLVCLVLLEIARLVVELRRFGRMAAYHMWSAKLWGIALWLGFSEVFLRGEAGPLFRLAVFSGILADLEGLAASIALSTWQLDVPSLWHALRREKSLDSAKDPS